MKYIIFFLILTGFLLLLVWRAVPELELTKWDIASLMQLLLLGTMISGSVVYFYQRKPAKALQHGLIWLLIAFVCVAFYTNKNALLANLVPGNIERQGADMLSIRAASDGHFYMNAVVNGKPIRFMIDTGASSITLPVYTANRIGIPTKNLAFTQPFQTANGQVFGAPTTLETLDIGGHIFEHVPAYINQGELSTPLMGIRFLDRTKSLEIHNDELIIRF